MTEAEHLLKELVDALDGAFISTWQSTHAWRDQLDAAREYIRRTEDEGQSPDHQRI